MITRIYVDRSAIERNREDHGNRAPFLIVRDGEETPASHVKIRGECELIYNPLTPAIPGIVAYIETEGDVIISLSQ